MTARRIKLNQFSDVRDFVSAAEKCAYDVDVYYNRVIIDAKSLLGVMSMDLRHVLTVKYYKEDSAVLDPVLERFAA